MEKVYRETVEKFQGRTKKKNKQWLMEETWKAIDQQQMIHDKIHCTKSERRKIKLQLEYKMKNTEVKVIPE